LGKGSLSLGGVTFVIGLSARKFSLASQRKKA
jgi:hypothetical protein